MNIKKKAKQFAIIAHKNQVRKAEPEKPLIIHPINVAMILEDYGYGSDENLIAAGYLHDVIEDTNTSKKDILDNFNYDVTDLIMGATEEDSTLPWEERKQKAIDKTRNLDLRHKLLICADKISNLEDIQVLMEKNSNYDFSLFNRGYEQQKWRYEEMYKSLIHNENINTPLFKRLKKLIDEVFTSKNTSVLSVEEKSKKIYKFRKIEIKKLSKILSNINQNNENIIDLEGKEELLDGIREEYITKINNSLKKIYSSKIVN